MAIAANLWFKSQTDNNIGCSINAECLNLFSTTYSNKVIIKAENAESYSPKILCFRMMCAERLDGTA